MSSGGKQLDFNTRERAVSTDVNRSQAFGDWALAEVMRRLVSMRGATQELGSYVDTNAMDTAAIGTPLKGDVLDGLVVLPQTGSLNLLVSPGAVLLDDPDGQTGSSDPNPASPDDSRAKLVVDAGISTVGALTIAAGSGGTRIDVIEVQRSETVIETDSRDIWDNSTGTFAPANVNKVIQAELLYRVRQGTPGAGLPASVQGWLPICVASVPSSATSVDTMTFWDVRPLVKDRVFAPHEQSSLINRPAFESELTIADTLVTAAAKLASGVVTSQIGMYRAGGILDFDLGSASVWGSGFAPSGIGIWYLYAVFPGGLPRWVKYTTSAPRVPSGMLGVLTVTDTVPSITLLSSLNSILPPASTGLGVVGPAAVLAAGQIQTDGSNFVPCGCIMSAGMSLNRLYGTLGSIQITPSSSSGSEDTYRLTLQQYPRGAKSLLLLFSATLTGGSANTAFVYDCFYDILVPSAGTTQQTVYLGTRASVFNGSGGALMFVLVEVPIPQRQVLVGYSSNQLDVKITMNATSGTKSNGRVQVAGWRL